MTGNPKIYSRIESYYFWLQKNWTTILIALYILFIFYTTLMPFQITQNLAKRITYLDVFGRRAGGPFHFRGDIFANIMFFLPLGILVSLQRLLTVYRRFTLLDWLRIVGTGALVSLTVELMQIFVPNRYPSVIDLASNTLGTFMGALFIFFLYNRFHRQIKNFLFSAFVHKPELIVAAVVWVFILVSQSAPFTFSVSIYTVRLLLREFLANPFHIDFFWSNLFFNLIIYGIFSYFLFLGLFRYHSAFVRQKTFLLLLLAVFLFPVGIEIYQLILPYRNQSLTDIFLSLLGITVGGLIALFQWENLTRTSRQFSNEKDLFFRLHSDFFKMVAMFYLLFLLFRYFIPPGTIGGWDPSIQRLQESLSLNVWKNHLDRFHFLLLFIKDVFTFLPLGFLSHHIYFKRTGRLWESLSQWLFVLVAASLIYLLIIFISHSSIFWPEFFALVGGIWVGMFTNKIYLYLNQF